MKGRPSLAWARKERKETQGRWSWRRLILRPVFCRHVAVRECRMHPDCLLRLLLKCR